MIRAIIQIGNPRLKAPNLSIQDFNDPKLLSLIADLTDTMRDADLVGIAAPQIAENYQVFLTEPRETKYRAKDQSDKLRVYINPRIVSSSTEEVIIFEGCGSVDDIDVFGPVNRPREVTVQAFDEQGKKFDLQCDGLLARVIQHELDHLNGIEFIDKADKSKLLSFEEYQKFKKNNSDLLSASVITKLEVTPHH